MLLLNQGPLNHRKVLNPSVIGVQKYIYKPFLLNFFISWFYQFLNQSIKIQYRKKNTKSFENAGKWKKSEWKKMPIFRCSS